MSNEPYKCQLEKGNNRLAQEMKASEDMDDKIARIYRLMENKTIKQRSLILTLIHQESGQEFWSTKTENTLYLLNLIELDSHLERL